MFPGLELNYKPQWKISPKDLRRFSQSNHRFVEEFDIVIQTYQHGFSDLYQLVHMPVGDCMKTANGNDTEKTLELQPGDRETLVPLLNDQAQGIAK